MNEKTIEETISVRNLVEFILRSGDIDSSSDSAHVDPDAMQEGSRLHRKIQKSMPAGYKAEVPLSADFLLENRSGVGLVLTIEGRADGIMTEETEDGRTVVMIDEIKTTYRTPDYYKEPVFLHEAQAKCYAAIYGEKNSLSEIDIQITYCNIDTEEIKRFRETYSVETLNQWIRGLAREYSKWLFWWNDWKEKRDASIEKLKFPFEYREGQRKLVEDVYRTISRGRKIFIEAPTGVGKTISTVFPSVWAVGMGKASKIFYLTAKTIARTVAEDTFGLLSDNGLKFRYVTLTAKEKICILEKPACNPNDCKRARGHYDRINECVFDLLTHEEKINRDLILQYSEKHCVCPFEMCLDVAIWSDAVIGDYNYAFDPSASLKRFFGDGKKTNHIFLIDEAHNLPERAREMYSAELVKERFLEVRRTAGQRSRRLEKNLSACNSALLTMKRECDSFTEWCDCEEIYNILQRTCAAFEDFFDDNKGGFEGKDEALELYFDIRNFLRVYENVDDTYRIFTDYLGNGDFRLKLMCMEPAKQLKERMDRVLASVLFSATLLPMNYYKEQLGGEPDDYAVYVPSPFSTDKRLILVGSDVSTKYTKRNASEFKKIAEYIENFVSAKVGNYMVFFTSYAMMENVLRVWNVELSGSAKRDKDFDENRNAGNTSENGKTNSLFNLCLEKSNEMVRALVQKRDMREKEKEAFLEMFTEKPDSTLVGFAVMGGAFSEGIDLAGNRLNGAAIVGCGLPMVGYERELYRDYFEKKSGTGFEYAYLYPGMNKVMQAAGRVIRTADDTGTILLLDERFAERQYTDLFPREWYPYERTTVSGAASRIKEFYGKKR